MKKYFIILTAIFGLFMLPVFAENNEEMEEIFLNDTESVIVPKSVEVVQSDPLPPTAPKWEEFCESGYENAKYSEKQNLLNVINVVDVERSKSNYWAERRANFEKAILHCNTMEDEKQKLYCYNTVRKNEIEKNEMYEQQRKQMIYKNRGIIIDKPNY